jgi:hypothetical protein
MAFACQSFLSPQVVIQGGSTLFAARPRCQRSFL